MSFDPEKVERFDYDETYGKDVNAEGEFVLASDYDQLLALYRPVKPHEQKVCPACESHGHKGIPATRDRHSELFDGDCDICGGYSFQSI